MSSTVISSGGSNSNSIHQGKLLVHIAENGHSYELECNENTPVEALMRHMEPVSEINFNDQLLLSLGLRLEPHRPLSAYKLPSNDGGGEVFIFNKARLQANSPPPQPEQIDIVEIPDPQLPVASNDHHPLDDDLDPALKALPSYERQFRHHYQRGHAIYSRTLLKYETCERLWREQKVQARAVDVACRNFDQYYRGIIQNYTEFMKQFTSQHRAYSDLLANFDKELEKLRAIKLHPSLQTSTRKCLLDLVKEDNLRKVADTCSTSQRQFENKVSQFKQMFLEVTHKVEELFASRDSLPIKNLDPVIEEHLRYINEQKSIMQSLSKDVSTVKKLVDDCVSCKLSSSLRPHDAVSALGPMYDVHDKNHLPKMQACNRPISKLLDSCKDKKHEMSIFLHNYVKKIVYFTYVIKDVKMQFPVFREAMVRQDELFADLKLVRGIGPAYRASLAEVVRRKASMKLYMGMAGQLAEKLATKREIEIRRREEFLKSNSSYMPRDLLASMGLYDNPSLCDVNISPFDTNLLDIDLSDLERYAPEHLAGLPSKHVSLYGSKELAVEDIEKYDSEQHLEACDLAEIAGTSKTEVENTKLKADLASAIAVICSLCPAAEYETLDDDKLDSLLKNSAQKTAEALHLKDEYAKHLQSVINAKHTQCESYVKRIKELEQRISDQYDASCISNSLDAKLGDHTSQAGKSREGVDENMMDSSGINQQMDSSMLETQVQVCNKSGNDKSTGQLGMSLTNSSTAESTPKALNVLPCDAVAESNLDSKVGGNLVLELQNALAEKSNQLSDAENSLEAAMNEVSLNCAHLENCLHEARAETQIHLCAAESRASEYSTLRASSVKMHGLFERLRSCVYASGGVTGFADSLRVLAQSMANSTNASEDDNITEFRKYIGVLADKVGFLSRHREELLGKCPKLEAANEQLRKELEEKKQLVKTLYMKHQIEKQANKEKISFRRFEVHELAAFVLNSSGHYEAINRNSSNYYLSSESVALFTEHLPSRPSFIVGHIVHIERQTVKSSPNSPRPEYSVADQIDNPTSETVMDHLALNSGSNLNPYGLPVGCEYFVVTIAMLPDTAIRSSSMDS
ncbi:hypothetical protein ACFE04_008232 [Oxalis oulophora]